MDKEVRDAILKSGTKDELYELRMFLFRESCRIENETCSLDEREKKIKEEEKYISDSRKKLEQDKERMKENNRFFEKKMDILRGGFDQLEADKRAFEKEKTKQRSVGEAFDYNGAELLFSGVNNSLALKKRYKDLLKIYHPDNMCGDTRMIQMINEGYSVLSSQFDMIMKA
ncbi:MAG: J domain-containing protein [Butyrivibrio sp.]|nr:J domain-containing protein [Butyrivibrio sp.]